MSETEPQSGVLRDFLDKADAKSAAYGIKEGWYQEPEIIAAHFRQDPANPEFRSRLQSFVDKVVANAIVTEHLEPLFDRWLKMGEKK